MTDRRCLSALDVCMCVINRHDMFQSSRFTGVRLWAVIALQTVWWQIGGRSRSWNKCCNCNVVNFKLWSGFSFSLNSSVNWPWVNVDSSYNEWQWLLAVNETATEQNKLS